jgi:hypothetical protein
MNTKSKNYKLIYKLFKTYDKLWEKKLKKETVKIDTPIHYGWRVYPKLRDDVAKRPEANILLDLLSMGYNLKILKNPKHVSLVRKKIYTVYRNNKNVVSLIPYKIPFSEKEYNDLDDKYKKYFYKYYPTNGRIYYELDLPEWYYYFTTKSLYTDKVYLLDSKLQSDITKLDNKLFQNNYWKLKYPAHHTKGDKVYKRHLQKRLVKKSINEDLDLLIAYT